MALLPQCRRWSDARCTFADACSGASKTRHALPGAALSLITDVVGLYLTRRASESLHQVREGDHPVRDEQVSACIPSPSPIVGLVETRAQQGQFASCARLSGPSDRVARSRSASGWLAIADGSMYDAAFGEQNGALRSRRITKIIASGGRSILAVGMKRARAICIDVIAWLACRYYDESKRLYSVLEDRLGSHEWLAADEYTIAGARPIRSCAVLRAACTAWSDTAGAGRFGAWGHGSACVLRSRSAGRCIRQSPALSALDRARVSSKRT